VTAQNHPLVAELARRQVDTLGLDLPPAAADPAAPLVCAGHGMDPIDTLARVVLIESDHGAKMDFA
jgi:hypothetical protein